MTRADANIVQALDDILGVYHRTKPKDGRLNIHCGWCSSMAKGVTRDVALSWFVEHLCKTKYTNPGPTEPLPERDYVADLRQREAAVAWEVMSEMILRCERTYGGHRHGLQQPTPEQLEHAERVNHILAGILGGVPQPRAPRAIIIRFPVERRQLQEAA